MTGCYLAVNTLCIEVIGVNHVWQYFISPAHSKSIVNRIESEDSHLLVKNEIIITTKRLPHICITVVYVYVTSNFCIFLHEPLNCRG